MGTYTLAELAAHIGGEVVGEARLPISGIAPLATAQPGQLSFLADGRYRRELEVTAASAVMLTRADSAFYSGAVIIVANPYLAYARVAALFDRRPRPPSGVHPTAVIAPTASIDSSSSIGPYVVIGAGASVGPNTEVGPGCSIGDNSHLGADCRLAANVTIYHGVVIGDGTIIHAGVVIGGDGFGFANDRGKWVKIPQIGGVNIGKDVEIGANTTIDRGAMEDTVIGNGVKMDNQIQVAHNVQIGDHTAIAGCVGIAGSAKIGRSCGIGGGAGILGHLEIVDGVQITAMSLVTKSIKEPGVYSSGTSVEPSQLWHKNYARFRQLDEMARRIKALEQSLAKNKE